VAENDPGLPIESGAERLRAAVLMGGRLGSLLKDALLLEVEVAFFGCNLMRSPCLR